MVARKKRGIGYIVSGLVSIAVGGVFIGTTATPEWVALAVQGVGMIASLLGFTTVFPDTD